MLFLSSDESKAWRNAGLEIEAKGTRPESFDFKGTCRGNLEGMFCFFVGTLLASKGRVEDGKRWLVSGASRESVGLFSNAYLSAFLERKGNRFSMPAVCFEDPRPFVHFAGVPSMKSSRESFVRVCGQSLPQFKRPFSIVDVGTGNGALLVMLLERLREEGKISDIGEIVLVDASPAMVDLAARTVSASFPKERIIPVCSRIEGVAAKLDGRHDAVLCSLSYHHMPYETKAVHLPQLAKNCDNFLIFELDADNDSHELHSPELACAVYQSYGRIIDYVFSHDAPLEVANACVDCFLLTEELSFLTQRRGERSDYHMLRGQWHRLFQESLKGKFSCRSETTCMHDDFLDLFSLHYGRD